MIESKAIEMTQKLMKLFPAWAKKEAAAGQGTVDRMVGWKKLLMRYDEKYVEPAIEELFSTCSHAIPRPGELKKLIELETKRRQAGNQQDKKPTLEFCDCLRSQRSDWAGKSDAEVLIRFRNYLYQRWILPRAAEMRKCSVKAVKDSADEYQRTRGESERIKCEYDLIAYCGLKGEDGMKVAHSASNAVLADFTFEQELSESLAMIDSFTGRTQSDSF